MTKGGAHRTTARSAFGFAKPEYAKHYFISYSRTGHKPIWDRVVKKLTSRKAKNNLRPVSDSLRRAASIKRAYDPPSMNRIFFNSTLKKSKKNLKMGQMADQPMATRRSPGPNQVVRGLKGDLKNIP